MNEYLIKKLKEGRSNAGLKQSDVAKLIGLKGNTLSNYENGVSEPDIDTFCSLCDIYGLDISDVLGEAYGLNVPGTDFDIRPSEIEYVKKYRALDPFGKETIDLALQREIQRVQTITELRRQLANQGERTAPAKTESATIIELSPQLPDHCHLIKYFRDASAGSGIFILGNEVSSQISVSEADWDDRVDYVIRVNGDSMMPDYQDGDNVMVSQRVELHYGDVGIFVVNGKAYIKEYGQTELISRNPESPNVSIGEHDNIVCMGKVIGKLTGPYEIIND